MILERATVWKFKEELFYKTVREYADGKGVEVIERGFVC